MFTISIGKAAAMLGVSVVTLRRWDYEGSLLPSYRTPGGHRRYLVSNLHKHINPDQSKPRKTVLYARVSSHDQKKDLRTQADRLVSWAKAREYNNTELIEDLGSGLNFKKRGLNRLLKMIFHGEVERLVVMHKDRLLRFGAELIFLLCKWLNVEVVIVEDKPTSFEEQLTLDVLEIMTVFSARLYGSRSHKNRLNKA